MTKINDKVNKTLIILLGYCSFLQSINYWVIGTIQKVLSLRGGEGVSSKSEHYKNSVYPTQKAKGGKKMDKSGWNTFWMDP